MVTRFHWIWATGDIDNLYKCVFYSFFFPCSYFWGVVADHKGRKPVIIASSIILGLSVCVFGFSVHFAMAILTRFLVGAANGKSHNLMQYYLREGINTCEWLNDMHRSQTSYRLEVSITVNLEIFFVKIFHSWRQLQKLILQKQMCTIDINVVQGHSYENFSTKICHMKNFVTQISRSKV